MKTTIGHLEKLANGLQELKGQKFNILTTHAILKNIELVKSEVQILQESRQPLLEKYGTDNGNGMYSIIDVAGFRTEEVRLTELEVEVELKEIKMSKISGAVITTEGLEGLELILK